MNRASRVKKAVADQKVIVVHRTSSSDSALAAAQAVVRAGLRLIDIPVTVPGVFDVIRELARNENLVLGAGSVTTMNEAADAIDAGAGFIVCPHTDRTIIDFCKDNGIFIAAACLTSTEAMEAYLQGVDLVAIYPVHLVGGTEYIRHILRPMPFLQLMPVGGIGPEEAVDHLKAGAVAVGVTDAILDPGALERGDWDVISDRARIFAETVKRSDTGEAE